MIQYSIHIHRRILVIFLTISCISFSYGQFSETISSDRPGQANGAYGVGIKVLQIQTGPEWNSAKITDTSIKTTGLVWPVTVRYGITENSELRFNSGFSRLSVENGISDQLSGVMTTMIGLRTNILEGDLKHPAIGILFDLGINDLVSKDFKRNHYYGSFMVIIQQAISERSAITLNMSTVWSGFSGNTTWPYVINYSYSLTGNLGLVVEHYGEFYDGGYHYNFDAGVGWLLTPDLLLDLTFGGGNGDDLNTWFVNSGLSWRYVKWRK